MSTKSEWLVEGGQPGPLSPQSALLLITAPLHVPCPTDPSTPVVLTLWVRLTHCALAPGRCCRAMGHGGWVEEGETGVTSLTSPLWRPPVACGPDATATVGWYC